MIKEGALENPKVDVIFGMHISSMTKLGVITYKPAGMMAASRLVQDQSRHGRQAHGSSTLDGCRSPSLPRRIIINGLQTIVSRQTDLTREAAVVTVGRINGGILQKYHS